MATSQLTTQEQLQSIWHLGGLHARELLNRVWNGINEDDLLGRASELAYNLLLAIFPLLLFLLSFLGLYAAKATQLQDNLFYYFSTVLPPAAFQLLRKTITEVIRNSSGGKLTFGIVLTLWFASGGMTSMISTLNAAYGVREGRSWIKVRTAAIALTAGLSVLILSALGLVLAGGHIIEVLEAHFRLGSGGVVLGHLLQWTTVLFFVVVSFSLIYYFGPDLHEQHWYWITPGSLVGVLLWLAASFGFRAYLHFFNSYSKTYGSLGAVIILLAWLYVAGLSFLVGGEINAQIEHAAAQHGHPEAKDEGEKKAA